MLPFFTFYGGKYRAAPRYPAPYHKIIVEPFAGSAGYATRYFHKKVILIEKDPAIAALWKYLIRSTSDMILALPLLDAGQSVDDFKLCDEEKTLIGFWLNKGAATACKTPGKWMREGLRPNSYWGTMVRNRLARQVKGISHWECHEGDYSISPDIKATWFIDPPYQNAGLFYKYSSRNIDFDCLSQWSRRRKGQIIVCENVGATWLPFEPFHHTKATPGKPNKEKSAEAIWEAGEGSQRSLFEKT